jgi:hypothetical protein
MQTRRKFIQIVPVAGAALLAHQAAFAQVKLDEKDPQAVALGYAADATKVDKAKQPKYAAGQLCGNCQLFQGAATDAAGACPLFAGKQIPSKGWCSAYVKKTG